MSTLLAPHDVTNLYIWCRSFERTTPIYFDKLVVDETQSAADFLREKAEIIYLASTSSLPDIIPMGLCINSHQLAGHMDYFRHHLTGMSPRLPEIYSTYRLFAHEVILITWLILPHVLYTIKWDSVNFETTWVFWKLLNCEMIFTKIFRKKNSATLCCKIVMQVCLLCKLYKL
jgi:hypothetical protein